MWTFCWASPRADWPTEPSASCLDPVAMDWPIETKTKASQTAIASHGCLMLQRPTAPGEKWSAMVTRVPLEPVPATDGQPESCGYGYPVGDIPYWSLRKVTTARTRLWSSREEASRKV